MTREEAIKTLKITHCKGCNDYGDCETCYIGVAIADMEKQIPKKPHRNYEKLSWKWCSCGWCLKTYEEGKNFCPNCGQALDWSEEND